MTEKTAAADEPPPSRKKIYFHILADCRQVFFDPFLALFPFRVPAYPMFPMKLIGEET